MIAQFVKPEEREVVVEEKVVEPVKDERKIYNVEIREEQIVIFNLLHVGFPAGSDGYIFVKHILIEIIRNKSEFKLPRHEIYPQMVNKFRNEFKLTRRGKELTVKHVENSVRKAITDFWENRDRNSKILKELYGVLVNDDNAPSTSVFLGNLAEYMKAVFYD